MRSTSLISQPFLLLIVFAVITTAPSCLPNGILDRDKTTPCIFFIPKTMQIIKTCSDQKITSITGPGIEVMYDSIKTIDGKAADRFTLFRSAAAMNFPYNLDTIIKDKSKAMTIYMATDRGNGYSYALRIKPWDWAKDTLFFTFYYRR